MEQFQESFKYYCKKKYVFSEKTRYTNQSTRPEMVTQIGTGTCDGLEALSLEEVLLLPVLPHQIGSLKQRVK
jgi:hypothetical protein